VEVEVEVEVGVEVGVVAAEVEVKKQQHSPASPHDVPHEFLIFQYSRPPSLP